MIRTYRGRCPHCCPDGGAYFERYGASEKKCNNCGTVVPLRKRPIGQGPTVVQQHVIHRILELFGGAVDKQHLYGRTLWVSVHNPDRHWITQGTRVYGTIGPRGALKLTLSRGLTPDILIRDTIALGVYLR